MLCKFLGLNKKFSVVLMTQLAVPHLEKTKGNIVNISSVAALKPVSFHFRFL